MHFLKKFACLGVTSFYQCYIESQENTGTLSLIDTTFQPSEAVKYPTKLGLFSIAAFSLAFKQGFSDIL
jgi:hypothetical protein